MEKGARKTKDGVEEVTVVLHAIEGQELQITCVRHYNNIKL